MGASNYPRFLSECITRVPGKQAGLHEDDMYGVYLSWCLLHAEKPGPTKSLWEAMRREGHIHLRNAGRNVWPEVSMRGPAAVDYILSSQPSLL